MREFVYGPALHQPPHAHDYSSVSMIVSGSLSENAERSEWRGGAGHVIVKPRDVVHDDRYGSRGARMFTLLFDAESEVGAYRWLFGGSAAALLARAVAEWRAGSAWQDIATDVVAAACEGGVKAKRSGSWDEIAHRFSRTHVTVDELAREMSMHPVALARAFRRHFGYSLTACRRRARVRRAVELLSATRMPLPEIAMECGFADQSHLCRVFRSEIGVTPSYFRAATV